MQNGVPEADGRGARNALALHEFVSCQLLSASCCQTRDIDIYNGHNRRHVPIQQFWKDIAVRILTSTTALAIPQILSFSALLTFYTY